MPAPIKYIILLHSYMLWTRKYDCELWILIIKNLVSAWKTALTVCKIVTFTFGPWIPSPGGPVGPAGPGLPTLPWKQMFKVIRPLVEGKNFIIVQLLILYIARGLICVVISYDSDLNINYNYFKLFVRSFLQVVLVSPLQVGRANPAIL